MPSRRTLLLAVLPLIGVLPLLAASARPAGAEDALVLQLGGFSVETVTANDELAAMLEGLGYTVAVRDPVAGDPLHDIEDFSCVFDLRPELADLPPDFADSEAILSALLAGRGVLFGGEHVDFLARSEALAEIVSTLGGGELAFDLSPLPLPAVAADRPQALNAAHPLAGNCVPVETLTYGGIGFGRATDTAAGTWVTGGPTEAGAFAFDRGDLAFAPQARLLAVLDINWASPVGSLDFLVEPLPALVPTENRLFLVNAIAWLCGSPGAPDVAPCERRCAPRNHGFWHRWCLGQDLVDPGRHGSGEGPGPSPRHEAVPADTLAKADGALAAHGLGACEALDVGPFSDERQAALRELATVQLDLGAGWLSPSCPVELAPVLRSELGLTVADALAAMEERLADAGRRALREARWIGEHVANGEALLADAAE